MGWTKEAPDFSAVLTGNLTSANLEETGKAGLPLLMRFPICGPGAKERRCRSPECAPMESVCGEDSWYKGR